jgi:hypothetical protein
MVDLFVYAKKLGPASGVSTSVMVYDTSVMEFIPPSTTPAGFDTGGEILEIQYGQYLTKHAANEYTVKFKKNGKEQEVAVKMIKSSNSVVGLFVEIPPAADLEASAGPGVKVSVEVTDNADTTRSIEFDFIYLDSTAPALVSGPVPTEAAFSGGETRITVKNIGDTAPNAQNTQISFYSSAAASALATILSVRKQ